MTRNWNRLLRECNGRYVAKLDADDAFQPHVLARLKESLESEKLSVAFCRTIDCDDELQPLGSYYGERAFILRGIEPREDHVRDGASWLDICFDGYQLWHSSSFLATRELLTDLHGWDERWGCAADTDLIHRILHHESRVASIGYPGLLYRRRSGSIFDGYKKRNWFKTEVLTVLLLSLHRMSSSGMVKSIRLRKTWGGLWLAREAALAELDATNRDFVAANADVPKPPWPYVTAYQVRELVAARGRDLSRIVRSRKLTSNSCEQ